MGWPDLLWSRPSKEPANDAPGPSGTPARSSWTSHYTSTATALGLDPASPLLTVAVPTAALTSASLLAISLYKNNLRRIPTANFVPPKLFRRKSLYGYVPSVGDGDNLRLFHTPGGRLAGWGILPWRRQHLPRPSSPHPRLDTIHVRLAGIDAPELAHFGRPAQPFGAEALAFLRARVLGRHVRAYVYRRDQYERVVGTAWVAGAPPGAVAVAVAALGRLPGGVRAVFAPVEVGLRVLGWGWNVMRGRRVEDVGLLMLREGLATVYEAKFGSEFGGEETERAYRAAEKKAKEEGKGMWGGKKSELELQQKKNKGEEKTGWFAWLFRGRGDDAAVVKRESPREYKNRQKELEEGKASK